MAVGEDGRQPASKIKRRIGLMIALHKGIEGVGPAKKARNFEVNFAPLRLCVRLMFTAFGMFVGCSPKAIFKSTSSIAGLHIS